MYIVLKCMKQLTQETQSKCIIDKNYSSKVKPDPEKHLFQYEHSQEEETRKEAIKWKLTNAFRNLRSQLILEYCYSL